MLDWLRTATDLARGLRLGNDKSDTLRSRIMPTPLPGLLRISLRQADGVFSRPLVSRDDRVLRYQAIAEAATDSGTPVYSPASGTVIAVDQQQSSFADNSEDLCITIAVDDEQQSQDLHALTDWRDEHFAGVIDRIEQAGVRGCAGTGYPVAKKLRMAREHDARLLIINAVECQPYVSADEALVREYAKEVVEGAEILRHAVRCERCVIAFQRGKPEALQALKSAIQSSDIEIHLAPDVYPVGNELLLIRQITGQEIPAGHYPVECGIVTFNAGTAYSVWQAVTLGLPCISRIVTLSGQALQTPKNFEAVLGTPVRHLLDLCGAASDESFSTIIGDPLSGHFLFDQESGIDIATRCIIAAGENEFQPQAAASPCNHCGDCLSACAIGLRPFELHRLSRAGDAPGLREAALSACIDCGACTYACPSSINLADSLLHGKTLLLEEEGQATLSEKWRQRYEFLQYRRKRDKQEVSERKNQASESSEPEQFSRDQARLDIAAAVARVKARREGDKQ